MTERVIVDAHVIIARYHWSITDIITNTILLLVRVDVVRCFGVLLGLSLFLIFATLGALDVGDCLLSVLCSSDLAFGRRLLAHTLASGTYQGRLTEDAVAARFAGDPTNLVWLGLFTLRFGSRDMAAS